MFERSLSPEKEAKSVNERKAELFAMTKNSGFDPKAVRAAFRQLVRELETPEAAQKHDDLNSLTATYLKALRGDRTATGQSDGSHPVASCDPSKGCSVPLARSRTREGVLEELDTITRREEARTR